ncbi:MAG: phospholipase [Acidobacteriota bacterium]
MNVDASDPHARLPLLREAASSSPEIALLLVHGRGAGAAGMLGLGRDLGQRLDRPFALFAPQAADATWYPGSFLLPLEDNEPWLSSGLASLSRTSRAIEEAGLSREAQFLVGFSQGACLACEFLAREGGRWGGLVAFTGGVQGPLGETRAFSSALDGTKIALSTGDPDPHVPVERVRETAALFEELGARVQLKEHPGRPHTILHEEVEAAADWLSFPG